MDKSTGKWIADTVHGISSIGFTPEAAAKSLTAKLEELKSNLESILDNGQNNPEA